MRFQFGTQDRLEGQCWYRLDGVGCSSADGISSCRISPVATIYGLSSAFTVGKSPATQLGLHFLPKFADNLWKQAVRLARPGRFQSRNTILANQRIRYILIVSGRFLVHVFVWIGATTQRPSSRGYSWPAPRRDPYIGGPIYRDLALR